MSSTNFLIVMQLGVPKGSKRPKCHFNQTINFKEVFEAFQDGGDKKEDVTEGEEVLTRCFKDTDLEGMKTIFSHMFVGNINVERFFDLGDGKFFVTFRYPPQEGGSDLSIEDADLRPKVR